MVIRHALVGIAVWISAGIATPHPPAPSASLSGIVMRSDGAKRPLPRAIVTVTGGSLASPRIVTTEDDGRFDIRDLSPGQYSVSAVKPAFLAMSYGASRPGRLGTSITLTEGQSVTGVTIALPRGAVISGVVTNAAGEPVPNAYVSLLRRTIYNGASRLIGAGSGAFTDDRGEYRTFGLEQGDYLVVVQPTTDPRAPADIIQLSDADVDRALLQARQPMTAIAAARTDTPRHVGFAPVFYPGTANGVEATMVNVTAGEERMDVNIRAELVPMARITGNVVAGGDGAASQVQVILESLGPPAPYEVYGYGGRLGPKTPDAQGRFTFDGVPPGQYNVIATTRPRSQPSGRGAASASPPQESRLAVATLNITGDDQSVSMSLRPGLAMSGRFVFEGTATPASLPGARLMLEDLRVDQSGGLRIYSATASPTGDFRIADILPGRFKLSNETAPGRLPTTGWALKSVVVDGRDVLDAPFELAPTSQLSDVVATFTDHPSELSGVLQAASGTPTSDYFIVVFPTSRSFWFPNSRRIMSARPDTNGRYSVRNLPAGEYFIAALTDVDTGEWFNADFLQTLSASAKTLTIADGEKKIQNLQIAR